MKLMCQIFLFLAISVFSMSISPVFAQQALTVGTVQKYIQKGMAQDQVVMALGSPNIVTQDANGKETWVYDKMSSTVTDRDKAESSNEKSSFVKNSWHAFFTLITLGLIDNGSAELRDVSQIVSSQNTLTVVIKFNENNCVESYSYHSSKF